MRRERRVCKGWPHRGLQAEVRNLVCVLEGKGSPGAWGQGAVLLSKRRQSVSGKRILAAKRMDQRRQACVERNLPEDFLLVQVRNDGSS